uniref:Uncharacterized protein n=1 Tax=Rangifer tarandus platyrhynchus TaxID=3082113 RepID=A0ACB0EXL0_RANTA|nr:unnamed protein product [Rangifer tarandus platyrhynchus]
MTINSDSSSVLSGEECEKGLPLLLPTELLLRHVIWTSQVSPRAAGSVPSFPGSRMTSPAPVPTMAFPRSCPMPAHRSTADFRTRGVWARGGARGQSRAAERPPARFVLAAKRGPRVSAAARGVEATPPLQGEPRPPIGPPPTNRRVEVARAVSARRSRAGRSLSSPARSPAASAAFPGSAAAALERCLALPCPAQPASRASGCPRPAATALLRYSARSMCRPSGAEVLSAPGGFW